MIKKILAGLFLFILAPVMSFASEADLKIPDLSTEQNSLLMYGLIV